MTDHEGTGKSVFCEGFRRAWKQLTMPYLTIAGGMKHSNNNFSQVRYVNNGRPTSAQGRHLQAFLMSQLPVGNISSKKCPLGMYRHFTKKLGLSSQIVKLF